MEKKMFEMGGYLPLEIRPGKEYFEYLPQELVRAVNSGRTALWWAVKSTGCTRVHVPYFYCPSVWAMLWEMGLELCPYHINGRMLPADIRWQPGDGVLLVNYYGLLDSELEALCEEYPVVFLDQAHDFFAKPVLKEGVYNIYSARKFVGVNDGAYLIGSPLADITLPEGSSSRRADHLLVSYEFGTNAAYSASKESEAILACEMTGMSPLTRHILQGADYEWIREKREKNFARLHRRLAPLQLLAIPEGAQPGYCYPLQCRVTGLREYLLSRHVFFPILWKEMLDGSFSGLWEETFAQEILCLPVDQRYDEERMDELADAILEYVNEQETGEHKRIQ